MPNSILQPLLILIGGAFFLYAFLLAIPTGFVFLGWIGILAGFDLAALLYGMGLAGGLVLVPGVQGPCGIEAPWFPICLFGAGCVAIAIGSFFFITARVIDDKY